MVREVVYQLRAEHSVPAQVDITSEYDYGDVILGWHSQVGSRKIPNIAIIHVDGYEQPLVCGR